MTATGSQPHLDKLHAWATERGLEVHASGGGQREPENVVAVTSPGSSSPLLSRTSLDSIDTAAMYLLNTIDRLRLDD